MNRFFEPPQPVGRSGPEVALSALDNRRDASGQKGLNALTPVQSARSRFDKLARPAHISVSRSIGYALTQDDEAGWRAFTALAYMRLTRRERASLAFAALTALDPADAELAATAALDHLYEAGLSHGW